MPNVKFVEFKIPPPACLKNQPMNFSYNHAKLEIWNNYMKKATDSVIFADCDMLAIRSAEHAFNIKFDVGTTWRTTTRKIPMNGGIIMARPTEKARKFFQEWFDADTKMLHDTAFHGRWRARWAGQNQSSFGFVFEQGKHGAKIHKYTTGEWNAVSCDWSSINEKTVFVHYKSRLRKIVLGGSMGDARTQKAASLWYTMRDQMRKAKGKKVA